MVFQNAARCVAQVFISQCAEQFQCTGTLSLFRSIRQELHDVRMVSSGFQNVCACLVHIQFQSFCKSLGLFFGGEAGYVSIADRIFLSHTPVVFLTLCIGHFREVGFFSRWHNVQGIGKYISRTVRKR